MSLATTIRIPAGSTEYIGMTVTGPEGVDLTDDTVQLAVVDGEITDSPDSPTWLPPSLLTFPSVNAAQAKLLIGPGGLVLQRGRYRLWAKISDTPEMAWVASPSLFQIF